MVSSVDHIVSSVQRPLLPNTSLAGMFELLNIMLQSVLFAEAVSTFVHLTI